MNTMRNIFLMKAFVCLFTIVALCSCKKDNDNEGVTITAIVENGSNYNEKIDAVKAVIYYGRDEEKELISAPYSNGGFTLKLPETVSDTYVYAFDEEGFSDDVEISDYSVKTGEIRIYAYKSGEKIGEFYYSSLSEDWRAGYMYSTGAVSVIGTNEIDQDVDGDGIYEISYEFEYNVHLKKGWNIVYYSNLSDNEFKMTTQKPSVTLKWYYDDYSSYSPQGVRAKKVPALFSKSKIRF